MIYVEIRCSKTFIRIFRIFGGTNPPSSYAYIGLSCVDSKKVKYKIITVTCVWSLLLLMCL